MRKKSKPLGISFANAPKAKIVPAEFFQLYTSEDGRGVSEKKLCIDCKHGKRRAPGLGDILLGNAFECWRDSRLETSLVTGEQVKIGFVRDCLRERGQNDQRDKSVVWLSGDDERCGAGGMYWEPAGAE